MDGGTRCALHVLGAASDRMLGEFTGTGACASSDLSTEQESTLRKVFTEDEAHLPAG